METSYSMGGYPLGASDDPRAPYNEKPPKKMVVNVTVSVTYSRTLDVVVDEGYTNVGLIEAVENMEILPNMILADRHAELRKYIKKNEDKLDTKYKAKLIKKRDNCKPWDEDELEVIENKAHLLL